jgi:hypothetical protein
VYSPRSVARAILYAAEHPVREVMVGGAGRVLEIGWMLAPSFVDGVMSRLMFRAMHSGRPRHGTNALFTPSEDLRERGEYRGIVRPSVYTALRTNPRTTAIAAGCAALLAGWLASATGQTRRARRAPA